CQIISRSLPRGETARGRKTVAVWTRRLIPPTTPRSISTRSRAENDLTPSVVQIPDTDRAVGAERGPPFPVWRDGDGFGVEPFPQQRKTLVGQEMAESCTALHVPEDHGRATHRGDHPLPVR